MAVGVVMRDLSIALAMAMKAFGQAGLTIALLMVLAYVLQIQSAAWYVRLADWIFGKTPADVWPQPMPTGGHGRTPIIKLSPMPPKPKRPLVTQFEEKMVGSTNHDVIRQSPPAGDGDMPSGGSAQIDSAG